MSLTDATSKRAFSASTESDGSVLLRGVLPGTYDVDVDCDGYVPEGRYEPIAVEEATSGLEWSVAVGQAIVGRPRLQAPRRRARRGARAQERLRPPRGSGGRGIARITRRSASCEERA